MTKTLAYTRPLVCRMWALLGPLAARHGYRVWRNTSCEGGDFPPVREVNVGARGEYGPEWVKPGQPLLDFGGHDSFEADLAREEEARRTGAQRKQERSQGGDAGAAGSRGPGRVRRRPGQGRMFQGLDLQPEGESAGGTGGGNGDKKLKQLRHAARAAANAAAGIQ